MSRIYLRTGHQIEISFLSFSSPTSEHGFDILALNRLKTISLHRVIIAQLLTVIRRDYPISFVEMESNIMATYLIRLGNVQKLAKIVEQLFKYRSRFQFKNRLPLESEQRMLRFRSEKINQSIMTITTNEIFF